MKNKSKESTLDYKQYTSHKDKTNYLYYDNIIFKGGGVSSDFFLRVPTTEKSVEVKLLNYLLDESHPSGGSKAKWLRKALNFTKENWKDLAKQLKFDINKAVPTKNTPRGQKYEQTITIRGANGKIIDVTFVWIRNIIDGIIRLVTMIPTERK